MGRHKKHQTTKREERALDMAQGKNQGKDKPFPPTPLGQNTVWELPHDWEKLLNEDEDEQC